MAILRKEIPKPLDFDSVIDTLYSIHTQGGGVHSSLGSASSLSLTNSNDAASVSVITSQRSLCSTHTTDGTIVVYYPSGRIAITCANVYGYFIETSTNTSAANTTTNTTGNNANSNQILNNTSGGTNQQNNSFSNQNDKAAKSDNSAALNTSATGVNVNLTSQNVKDSYTTIIFDDSKPRGENVVNSATSRPVKSPTAEGRMMALVTSTGYCVCYRRNGALR
jgi:hypothetical protein